MMKNHEDVIIEIALQYLQKRLRQPGAALTAPEDVRNFLSLKIADREHEVFAVMFLNIQNKVIGYEEMFRGTIDGAAVHPREVAKAALMHNAAAIICAHNHPSGMALPSEADKRATERLSMALGLLDIRLLDHLIIGGMGYWSFSEHGWL